MPEPLLEARGIVKSFGRVRALRGANFTVFPNEVVALVGDNGAGKSTLVKTLAGVHQPDEGEILFDGELVEIHTPLDARRLGIETVYQDLALAAELDAGANMFLGREIMRPGVLGRLGFIDKQAMRVRSREAFTNLGVALQDTAAPVATMSGGQRQVLVDGLDPQPARVERGVDLDRLALEEDLAGVGLVHACQRLDEGRLAGAVVSDERDDLVGVDGEARAAQRADAAEALDDPSRFEQGLGHQWAH